MRSIWLLGLLGLVGCASVENRLLYHPAEFVETDALPTDATDVSLKTTSETQIHAHWHLTANSRGAILYCPGNAGNLQSRAKAVRELGDALGRSVLIFDYPGFGKSQGEPNEAGCYEAASAAYEWLIREAKIAPDRIVLYGESLGGAVAVDLASKKPHGALVLVRAFTSAPEVADYQFPLFPGNWVMTNRFDSLAKIPLCKSPVFIAQADKDRLVPMRHGEQLLNACVAPAQLCVLKNLGHNDPLPADFHVALRDFIGR